VVFSSARLMHGGGNRKPGDDFVEGVVVYLMRLGQEIEEASGSAGAGHSARTRCTSMRPAQGSPGSLWDPPTHAAIKLNVDGAFNSVTGEAAVGLIARDHGGNPHVMSWRLISNCRDAEEAEALACLEGVKLLHH
jgi:hypothetical protein